MYTLGTLRRRLHVPRTRAVALLLIFGAGACPFADPGEAGATSKRYVAPGGSDAGPGTRHRPWRSVQKALDTLKPGQTAYLASGTYPAQANFERSGRRGALVTIRNLPGARPLVTGRLRIRGSHFTVRGLHFRGQTAANPDDYLIYLYGGDHVTIAGNELERGYKSAIYVGEPDDRARHLRLIGNHIHHNGKGPERRWRAHGLYCGHCEGGLVANNVFDHNLAWNLQLYPDSRDLLVTQNTIVHAGASGIMVGGDGERASQGIRIVNNIVAANAGWGLQMYSEGGGPLPARTVAVRNLFHANGDGAVRAAIGGLGVSRSIHRDPRFRGPGDFRLRRGSPALDRAVRRWTLPFDHDGRARPRGPGSDLGAFER